MFYCEPCGEERGWPTYGYLPRSRGGCEVCRKGAVCYDVPSRNLPMPKTAQDGGDHE